MKRTPEQLRAIKARGKVMVSASAGAGKTSVMIERLADIIAEGATLDEILAVTFTKKAAAQMKTKLRGELIARLKDCDGVVAERIKKQLSALGQADISTIHSFCARLIRTYFYVLDVDAGFEILADGYETQQFKQNAVDQLFDRLYDGDDEDLVYALERLRSKRSDDGLKKMIISALDDARILPDYAEKLAVAADETFSEQGFAAVCGEYLKWRAQRCNALLAETKKFADGFAPPINADKYGVLLDEACDALQSVAASKDVFSPLPPLVRTKKPNVKPEVAEADEAFKAFIARIKGIYSKLNGDIADEATERSRYFESGRLARAFARLVLLFDAEYAAIKRDEGKLDYADLEQLTYRLLKYGDGDIRNQIRCKYKYVFVDEYQDVNPIQAAICDMTGGGDVFAVGDVKQAIYGFRGSKARIFTDKCEAARATGDYIVLPDNFRSSRAVIDFVNALFPTVMTSPLSDIDYSDGHAMRGGSRYPEEAYGRAAVRQFDKTKEQKEQADGVYSVIGRSGAAKTAHSGALAVLAAVKEELKKNWYDADAGCEKPVQAGDICVLTRKRSNAAVQAVMRTLGNAGYGVTGVAEQNVLEISEVRQVCDVLEFLDNSLQDIPLASAMLSPLGDFTEDELAEIKIKSGYVGRGVTFRQLAADYCRRRRDALAAKLAAFFAEAERLRKLSDYVGAATLIDELLTVGGFVGKFASKEKLAGLRRLQSEAYTPRGELSLAAFIIKLKAGGYKVTAPVPQSADSITVMTMHASKGLEFPVVIVTDISESFEGDGGSDEMPFDEDFGFAPRYYDTDQRVYKNTMLRRVISLRERREELNNEINLFYVACTRAKYSLQILSGGAEYDALSALNADCYAKLFDAAKFNPAILPVERLSDEGGGESVHIDEARADDKFYGWLTAQFDARYPYESGADLPVKSSASRLIRFDAEDDVSPRLFEGEQPRGATGIERGIAYHRFLELYDFSRRQGAEKCIEEWVEGGLMTEAQSALLDGAQLERILAMPALQFGGEVRLYKEREFICRLSSEGYRALERGEKADFGVGEEDGNGVIVQGAVDLLALGYDGGKVVRADIIDYKFSSRGDEYLLKEYAPQLRLYRQVVRTVFGLSDEAVTTRVVNIFAVREIGID